MKIYWACAIKTVADPFFQAIYTDTVRRLEENGHKMFAPFLLDNRVQSGVKERDIAMISICDALIAECSNPSTGVGWEICYAENVKSKRVLVLHSDDRPLSAMITPSQLVTVCQWANVQVFNALIDRWLERLGRTGN